MTWQKMTKSWQACPTPSNVSAAYSPTFTLPLSWRRRPGSTIYYGRLISLCLCLQMPTVVAGAFQVRGPHEPVVAMLGSEAKLPCFLLPAQSAKNIQITWSRPLSSQVVHLYKDGRDQPKEALEEYIGRTELVRDAIDKGTVVLKILNVQPSDDGQYRCGFQYGSFYNDTVMELKVAVLGLDPHIHMEFTKSREIRLECKSEGWFPQPKVQWTNSQGEEILSISKSWTQDKSGLFQVSTSLLLRETSQKKVICSVWNPVLNQKKEEQLSIAVVDSSSSSFYVVILTLAPIVILLTFVVNGLCLYKKR